MKTAFITGITGQDGSFLAELLLSKDYRVVGMVRRSSTNTKSRISNILDNPNLILLEGDLLDSVSINSCIQKYQPDEVYNLAAQSHVGTSFESPVNTMEVSVLGTLYILEAIRHLSPLSKFYQASTSEMFGSNKGRTGWREIYCPDADDVIKIFGCMQDETTPFLPQSPYAIAKLASHNLVNLYRKSYGIFAASGILFNHESCRRGENFVTRKITKYVGDLVNGRTKEKLHLGNIHASRDWGDAQDYVAGMHLMLQHDKSDNYVLATGITHTVKEFCYVAFALVGLDYLDHIEVDQKEFRPSEVQYLRGDSSLARNQLGWKANTCFKKLIHKMLQHDVGDHYKLLDIDKVSLPSKLSNGEILAC